MLDYYKANQKFQIFIFTSAPQNDDKYPPTSTYFQSLFEVDKQQFNCQPQTTNVAEAQIKVMLESSYSFNGFKSAN